MAILRLKVAVNRVSSSCAQPDEVPSGGPGGEDKEANEGKKDPGEDGEASADGEEDPGDEEGDPTGRRCP